MLPHPNYAGRVLDLLDDEPVLKGSEVFDRTKKSLVELVTYAMKGSLDGDGTFQTELWLPPESQARDPFNGRQHDRSHEGHQYGLRGAMRRSGACTMSRRRFEVLIDDEALRELAEIAFHAGTTRSHLIRKAVRLYLMNRKPS